MAELSGKFRHEAVTKGDYPAVGDWVYIKKIENEKKAIIHRIFREEVLFQDKKLVIELKNKLLQQMLIIYF